MAEDDWSTSIRTLAAGLLTLEVNTIEKQNMTASKMPDLPLALHEIVQLYERFLSEEDQCFVTDELLGLAKAWVDKSADEDLDRLKSWWVDWKPSADGPSEHLTNGPATFEALRWVAKAALKAYDQPGKPAARLASHRTLLYRIENNCRLLRQLGLTLVEQNPGIADVLFDGTVEQTARALFARPRPRLDVDTDIIVQVRKIWDLGTEQVMFQTVMQVDGDVLVRMAPSMDPANRAFFSELHRSTVDIALSQWRTLFELAGTLVGSVGRALFGGRP